MNLLKVGDRIINLDLVTDIHLRGEDEIVFHFAAPSQNGGHIWIARDKEQITALKDWLQRHAEDIEGKIVGLW